MRNLYTAAVFMAASVSAQNELLLEEAADNQVLSNEPEHLPASETNLLDLAEPGLAEENQIEPVDNQIYSPAYQENYDYNRAVTRRPYNGSGRSSRSSSLSYSHSSGHHASRTHSRRSYSRSSCSGSACYESRWATIEGRRPIHHVYHEQEERERHWAVEERRRPRSAEERWHHYETGRHFSDQDRHSWEEA